MKTARLAALLLAVAATPAFAQGADDQAPVTHTDQLVVVTPNPPVMVINGAAQPQPQPQPAGPGAVAPTAPAVMASGAPVNEPWNGVSHINGTLIKVGERGDYLLRYRKNNISTNPIGWIFGFYGVSASHAISENVAIRGDANLMSTDEFAGYELGISLPIYFKRVYSGPFIEPGIIARGMKDKNSYCDVAYSGGSCMETTDTMVGPEVMFGWHWTFDSGFNAAMAFGAARNIDSQNGEDVQPAGYFRVGYAY